MRLAAYLRVSTDVQAERGHGLDVQENAVKAWAKAHKHSIVRWARDEGISGSNGLDSRVGLLDALCAVQEGAAKGLVVYRLDRLARDLILQEQLLAQVWRSGGRVYSTFPSEDAYLDPDGADADPSRALIRQILGAVSQYERAMVRLRLQAGKAHKRQQGGFIGGQVPLGYRTEARQLVPDESEQRVIERTLDLRSQGLSLREIGAELESEGLTPKRGGRWHPQKVAAILRGGKRREGVGRHSG